MSTTLQKPMDTFKDPDILKEDMQYAMQNVSIILQNARNVSGLIVSNPYNNDYKIQLRQLKLTLNEKIQILLDLNTYFTDSNSELNDNIKTLKNEITAIKNHNKTLLDGLNNIDERAEATDELINNYKYIYNVVFLKNWGLFLSIIICWIVLSAVFKKKQL